MHIIVTTYMVFKHRIKLIAENFINVPAIALSISIHIMMSLTTIVDTIFFLNQTGGVLDYDVIIAQRFTLYMLSEP